MAKQLVFYTNPQSRGQIARWALEEVGADYQQVIVEYGEAMKSNDYLAINPMGKVPAIKHGDKVITECAAICAYLGDVFPKAALAPASPERADYYRWLFFAAGPLESAVINQNLGIDVSPDKERMAGYGNYDLTIQVLDDFLQSRDYVCGHEFTMADVYLGSHVDWGLLFGTIKPRASFEAYVERLRARPAYQKAKQIDNELIASA